MESRKGGLLEAVVGDYVVGRLGRPPGLRCVQARQVFGSRYRVNVFVGDDTPTARIAHSYFLEADGDGKILSSTPALTRVYPPEEVSPPEGGGASEVE
ncbi:MAG: hypothetical protein U0797_24475 [Gemmataceae bacterium]